MQWRCCMIHAIGSKVSGTRCLNANCTDMENILFANSLTQTSTTCDLQLKMSDFFKKTPIKNFGAPWSKDSTWKNSTRHFGVNYKRTTTQIVWSHISDGFQQDSTSDGLDPSALQKSVMDFNSEKRSEFVGSDMGWSSGSNEGSLGMERLYCPMCFYSMRKD